jgi:carbamoyl-phosphate synthase large subunit
VGHPNVVDVIQDRTVDFVVNTSEGGRTTLRDGFHIRRAASEHRIPCFTSIDTALHAVAAMVISSGEYDVQPMSVYTHQNGDNHVGVPS